MHIVITRPKEDSAQLIEVLKNQGHLVTHIPVIKIEKFVTIIKVIEEDGDLICIKQRS